MCTILVYQYCDRQVQEIPLYLQIKNQSYFPVFPTVLGNMSISHFFANPDVVRTCCLVWFQMVEKILCSFCVDGDFIHFRCWANTKVPRSGRLSMSSSVKTETNCWSRMFAFVVASWCRNPSRLQGEHKYTRGSQEPVLFTWL